MKKGIKTGIKYIFPLLIGFGILTYLYQGIQIEDLQQVLQSNVKWQWILLSLLFATLSHILRALRWRLQLDELQVKTTTSTLVNAVFGGYAVNLILPRLGEIWRCNYLSKQVDKPFSSLLGTLVSERLFDVLFLGLFVVATFFLQPQFFLSFFESYTLADKFEPLMWALMFLGLFVILSAASVFYFWDKIQHYALVRYVHQVSQKLLLGINTLLTMPSKGAYLLSTGGIWILYFLNFYVCLFAFDFTQDITFLQGLTLFVMGSIAVIAPVQGGIGPWHFMLITTLVQFGVAHSQAAIFALVVHAIQQLFVLLLGVYAFISIYLMQRKTRDTQLTV